MKKVLFFVAAMCCATAMFASQKIYLNTGGNELWGADAPAFFVHPWVDGGAEFSDVLMTKEADDLFSAEIDDAANRLLFIRAKSEATSVIWDGDDKNVWNQTGDLEIEEGKDLFTITAWHEDGDDSKPSAGEWSKKEVTGIDHIVGNAATLKVMENGVMYIYRNGVKFDAQGKVVR